tara:strand:+ start:33 stop:614 length:582 start_codon:yes stop_codon:yes gene_type:complete
MCLYNNLPHNNPDIADSYEAINVVDHMIDNMRLTLEGNVYNPNCYLSKNGIVVQKTDIRLYEIFLEYLSAVRSHEYSLEHIEDVQDKMDYFEERAHGPVVQSDIEDKFQIVQELSQNLSLMIDKLVLEEACFLICKKNYFYACVEKISAAEEWIKEIWGSNLSNSNREWFERQKLPLLDQIELLEEQIQRSLT